MLGFRHWKAGTLLGTWIAHWLALLGVSVGPGLLNAWELTRERGSQGTMTASIDGGRLPVSLKDAAGAEGAWSFETTLATALAWIALPPLALWVLWLTSRPRDAGAR